MPSSSSGIQRKLLPAKNAWKRLAATLRSKLFKLKRSKAFKRTATGLNAAVSTVLGGRRRFRLKKRALTRLPSDAGRNRKKPRQQQLHGVMPVYVDELFNKPAASVHIPAIFVGKVLVDKPAAAGGVLAAGADTGSSSSQVIKADDHLPVAVGKVATSVSPGRSAPGGHKLVGETKVEPSSSTTVGIDDVNLEEVDLKAELFIAKFREEIRLQRQRSFDEYQQMLARGL